jgi:protein subunit release factor B
MRELLFSVTLADCDVQTKRGSGKGGQHRNKRDTAVRIVHRASGAVGESQEQRSQYQNKRTAFIRMTQTTKFRVWVNREVFMQGRDPEAEVRREMQQHNLLIEGRENDRWVPIA